MHPTRNFYRMKKFEQKHDSKKFDQNRVKNTQNFPPKQKVFEKKIQSDFVKMEIDDKILEKDIENSQKNLEISTEVLTYPRSATRLLTLWRLKTFSKFPFKPI